MPIRPHFINIRLLFWTLSVTAVLAGTDAGAFFFQRHRANGAVQRLSLPSLPRPTTGASILVVAPHCDDETLGAGGLLHEAIRTGARVRVVFLTNGDGFPLAVSKQYFKLRPTRNSFIRFAYHRQAEAIAALGELGVQRDQITFLGYPDGGLSTLWNRNWSPGTLYRSRFTGCTRSPYDNSFRPGAPYCGRALLDDLRAIVRRENPTDLIVPHPGDDHPDHWAGYCFAVAALRGLRLDAESIYGPLMPGWGSDVRLHTYLVHRGDWPVPQGLRPDARLVPPAALLGLDTRWVNFPLSPPAQRAKERALSRYRSQMAVMRRFLQSFLRADELFGTLPPAVLKPSPAVSPIGLPRPEGFGATEVIGLSGVEAGPVGGGLVPVIIGSEEDTLLRDLNGSADIDRVEAATDGHLLHLRLTARRTLSPRVRYRLRLHPLGCRDLEREGAPLTVSFRGNACSREDLWWEARGRVVDLFLPLATLGRPRELLLSAETEMARVVVDRTCWRAVRLSVSEAHLAHRPR